MKLLSGNEAIALAALNHKADFFAAYPITPASEISHYLAKQKIKFIQAEDEIASIAMCIGASLAGAKAFTATSGPGLSLMQENIGLAYKLESPLLIVDCQRVGPSTGMPTLPSQGDIDSIHGTHGDKQIIALAPNSVEECYRLTQIAFNIAEESLSPVMLMIDGFLSHLYENISVSKIKIKEIKRNLKPLGKGKRHFSGLLTKDNYPATKDPEYYKEWFKKRKKQILNTAEKYDLYEYIQKNSDTLLIAYGTPSRVIQELDYDIFRPIRLFPISKKLKEISKNYKKIICIEMNDGQYKNHLQSFLKKEIKSLPQLGGKLSLQEIKNEIRKIA